MAYLNGVTKIVYGTAGISNPDREIARRRPSSAEKEAVFLSLYQFGSSSIHNLRDTVHTPHYHVMKSLVSSISSDCGYSNHA